MHHDVQLIENDIKSFNEPIQQEMEKAVKHFEGELIKIRTGRAHTSLIEDVQVSAYGQPPVPLKSLASLAAPDVRLITVQPWDASVIPDIEKAILASSVGVTPANDGVLIRIQLPEMSSDRRDDLIKILGKKLEESKVSIRNIRKDYHNIIRDAKKDKKISENFFNRLEDELQKATDVWVKKVDQMAEKKKVDITTV